MQPLHEKHLNTCLSFPQHVPPLLGPPISPFPLHKQALFPPSPKYSEPIYINSSLQLGSMAEFTHHHHYQHQQQQQQSAEPRSRQMVKAATAVTAGGSLLLLSGLTLAGTVIALTIATPLLVIFSPVIVPAVITVALLVIGFLASGGFGVAAVTVLTWIYRYVTGGHPLGADQLDSARMKLASKAREMKDRAEQLTGVA